MTRRDPNQARQKFYTERMNKGCTLVAFYNHRDMDFSQEEINSMVASATAQYSNLPWQNLAEPNEKPHPLELFVWVDIHEDKVWIGLALASDGAAIGCVNWNQTDHQYNGSAQFICSCLDTYARVYWEGKTGNLQTR